MLITLACCYLIGIIQITAIQFHIAFVEEKWLASFALQRERRGYQSTVGSHLESTCSRTLNGIQKSLRNGSAVVAKYMCIMLEVVRVADLICEDVQDQTVPLEHTCRQTR